jgi:hypothetical protein
MIARFRPQLTFANVVSIIALFVALGGSSYAAIRVSGKNVKNSSLTGSDVKNNSLTGRDVARLGSGDVRDFSLLAKDFKRGQLPAGPQGPRGLPSAGATYSALVDFEGKLVGGSAVGARKVTGSGLGDGNYAVTFPRSVQGCGAAGNTATFPGFIGTSGRTALELRIGFDNPNEVGVQVQATDSSSTHDSAFSLVVSCP